MLKVTEVDVYGGFTQKLISFNAKAAEELDFTFLLITIQLSQVTVVMKISHVVIIFV